MSEPARAARVETVRAVLDQHLSDAAVNDWPDTEAWAMNVVDAIDAASEPSVFDLIATLQGRRRDALRALLACTETGADYWRWQGHAELSRQLLRRLGAHVPQVLPGGGVS